MNESLKRKTKTRKLKKVFVIATEGEKTEKCYFEHVQSIIPSNNPDIIIDVKPSPNGLSAPNHVLERIQKFLTDQENKTLTKGDEAWIVIDRDKWRDDQIKPCYDWSKLSKEYGFALSNPLFEFWLLLHFFLLDYTNPTSDGVLQELKKHIPGYNKNLKRCCLVSLSKERIQIAIDNAKKLDTPPCKDWPKKPGSTIYHLVENILNSAQITE